MRVGPAAALALAAAANAAGAAPAVERHALRFLVHAGLLTPQETLAVWEARVLAAVEDANRIVEGEHGPFDAACCARLAAQGGAPGLSIDSFDGSDAGRPASDLLVPASGADFDALRAIGGSGSTAFVVESLAWCGAPTGVAIGCADQPSCPQPGGDDPLLVLVVTREAFELGRFAATLAHERGHNTCLGHADSGGPPANLCQLMRSSAGGACLDASECTQFRNGGVATAEVCACHDDALGTLDNGAACTVAGPLSVPGLCSGGVCGGTGSEASVELVVAGGVGAVQGVTPDAQLRVSGLTGGWRSEGSFGGGAAPRGLEYAPGRGLVYAVAPTAGDDNLFSIDPQAGAETTVGTVTGFQGLEALAFDPGPSAGPADDRLLALDGETFQQVIEIDPDSAAPASLNPNGLSSGFAGDGLTGLAYDANADRLYAVGDLAAELADPGDPGTQQRLYEIDLASCTTQVFCEIAVVPGQPFIPTRGDPGLAWSADTGKLVLMGWQQNTPTLYESIDPQAGFVAREAQGVDPFTVGGLAAVPVVEPPTLAGGLAALAGAARLARRRVR